MSWTYLPIDCLLVSDLMNLTLNDRLWLRKFRAFFSPVELPKPSSFLPVTIRSIIQDSLVWSAFTSIPTNVMITVTIAKSKLLDKSIDSWFANRWPSGHIVLVFSRMRSSRVDDDTWENQPTWQLAFLELFPGQGQSKLSYAMLKLHNHLLSVIVISNNFSISTCETWCLKLVPSFN